jgi:hypothetical protein
VKAKRMAEHGADTSALMHREQVRLSALRIGIAWVAMVNGDHRK